MAVNLADFLEINGGSKFGAKPRAERGGLKKIYLDFEKIVGVNLKKAEYVKFVCIDE